jgi:hypothetical protein
MAAGQVKWKLNLQAVLKAAERCDKKLQFRIAGYIRSIARNSIKSGAKGQKSKKGGPPLTWTKRYKNSIVFAYDSSTRSTVVGGLNFGGLVPIPSLIETGGMAFRINKLKGTRKLSRYQPRPAMRLALAVAIEKIIPTEMKDYIR